jgi:outer membrane murein-binding lipoprotein Lpp
MNCAYTAAYRTRAPISLIGAAAGVAVALAGCVGPGKPSPVASMQKQVLALEAQVSQLQQRVANQEETIEDQRKQITDLQELGPNRPLRLAPLEGIRFASLSGGYDPTGSGNDQGIVLYVQPYDADGDAIKAAGDLSVRLFNLNDPAGPQLISQCTWNAEQLRKMWNQLLMTGHFSAVCLWPKDYQPPRQVTAQAQFLDFLTGKTFTCQAVFNIKSTEPLR